MAVDTRDKRSSAASVQGTPIFPGPDGSIANAPDRRHAASAYSFESVSYDLVAATGAFTLTGNAATLTKSGVATGGGLVRLGTRTNEVNWDDPLNKGLIHWWRMRQGDSWQRMQDYGRDSKPLLATAATDPDDLVLASAKNLQYATDLNDKSEAFEAANVSANISDYTVACWIKPIAGTNLSYVSHHSGASSNDGWRIVSTNTSLQLVLGGVAAYSFSGPTLTYDEWQFVAIAVSGSTATGFVNFDSASTSIGSLVGTPTRYQVGATKAGGNVGTTSDVRVYNRALSESEVHDLYAASRTGYRGQLKRRYIPLSATISGAQAYTLTVDTGAFTLTGNDADPDADRQLTASTGSYTLTGNDAILTKSSFSKFVADTGTFTLTGNDIALKADHDVAASTGSYTLTGNAADLPADRQLAADTASVSLTGNDATLTYSAAEPTLVAATGEFTLTGGDATLTVSRKLTADTTSYTVAGNDAATKASRKFLATVASFDLDGPAVNLELSRRIALDTLTYNLTGVNTRLSYSEEDVSSIIQATSASIRCPQANASIRCPQANGSISCADSDGTFVTP